MKNIVLVFVSLLTFYSCSTSEVLEVEQDVDTTKAVNVSFSVNPIEFEGENDNMTRVVVDVNTNTTTYNFLFSHNDSIGIFPDVGYQIPFVVTTPDQQPVASTNVVADGWNTKKGITYVSYLPFNYNNKDSRKIPLSLLGQEQLANNSTEHLSKYSFLASALIPFNEETNGFDFKLYEQNSTALLKITLPESALSSVFTKAVLEVTGGNKFYTSGTMDLVSEGQPFTPDEESATSFLSVKLNNIPAPTSGEDTKMYIHLRMIPVTLVGEYDLILKLYTTDGKLFTTSRHLAQNLSFNRNKGRGINFGGTSSTFTMTTDAPTSESSVSELNQELSASVDKSDVNVELTASTISDDIVIPSALSQSGDASVRLSFESIPTVNTASNTIVITDNTGAEPSKSVSNVVVSMPSLGEGDEAPSLTITLPTSSVSLNPANGTANFNVVNSTTGLSTLYIEPGVTVNILNVYGGNVVIREGATVKTVIDYTNGKSSITNWNDGGSTDGEVNAEISGFQSGN